MEGEPESEVEPPLPEKVPKRPKPEDLPGIRDNIDRAMDATGAALTTAARTAFEGGTAAGQSAVKHLTFTGRLIERGLRFFVKISNPPWTRGKVLFWVTLTLLIASAWIIWREVELGVLDASGLGEVGRSILDSAAALGPFGLFAITALATLFFLFIPSEPYYFLALAASPNIAVSVTAAALGSIVGACANFWFGEVVVERRKRKRGDSGAIGKWGKRAESKWGEAFLFLAMALPAPEIIAVGYGAATFSFRKFLVIVTAARFVKWSWVALLYLYFDTTF